MIKPLNKTNEIQELTGIRFFAALHVVFFHNFFITGPIEDQTPQWILNIISQGHCAVTFFFILSGFILTYVYATEENEIKTTKRKFFFARFSRIYPLYLFAFLIDLPRGISFFIEKYGFSVGLQKILISAGAHITMLQSWHPRLTPVWNSPAWSLSTEMFFYITAPFAIPYILRLKKNYTWMFILYLVPIVLFFSLQSILNINLDTDLSGRVFWRSFPLIRSTEFFLGIFLGKLFIQKSSLTEWMKKNESKTSFIFWASLISSFVLISVKLNVPEGIFANTFLVPLFAVMIISIASARVSFAGFLKSSPIVLLGGASYALYISHVPLLYYANHFFQSANLEYGLMYYSAYLFLAILSSIALYKGLELPMQKWLRDIKGKNI